MLVLTRRKGESIRIADGYEVIVISIHRGRVRLGINCARDIPVHRGEVQERIDCLQTQSLKGTTDCHAKVNQRMGDVKH